MTSGIHLYCEAAFFMLFRNIRSKKKRAAITILDYLARKALEKDLKEQVSPALIRSHNLIVADWKNKPTFETRISVRPDKISMTVFPAGDAAGIYEIVDQGSPPHIIRPVKAKFLVFRLGYQSKTLARPARTVSGGGKATGDIVRAKLVHHPGSEGRFFSKQIAEDIKPDFKRIIDNTFRRVSKQLEE